MLLPNSHFKNFINQLFFFKRRKLGQRRIKFAKKIKKRQKG